MERRREVKRIKKINNMETSKALITGPPLPINTTHLTNIIISLHLTFHLSYLSHFYFNLFLFSHSFIRITHSNIQHFTALTPLDRLSLSLTFICSSFCSSFFSSVLPLKASQEQCSSRKQAFEKVIVFS